MSFHLILILVHVLAIEIIVRANNTLTMSPLLFFHRNVSEI